MNIERVKNNLLGINNLRKQLGNINFWKIAKSDLALKVLKKPEGKKILVLSPHPDDDVFGCGGTLALYPKTAEITSIYFSNGSRDNIESKGENEAKASGKILNLSEQIFLKLPDGEFSASDVNLAKFLYYLKKSDPDVVYLPFFLDPNPDHQEVCRFVYKACQRFKKELKLYSFEIWNPLFPNRLIDIKRSVKTKIAAIRAHKSQLQSRDYEKAILGLNQYRGQVMDVSEFAEAFYTCDKEKWLDLFQRSQINL
ncbi:MAG: PIG-L family deacetylase [Candidatus Berkelbacteria bacterium]|nr:PIG-L family deacetylase [Candidatus Berkelbacteria bacterium]